jgi:predicted ATPase
MQLQEFQITNYRSINDSGPVAVSKITSLVGRNESGKSNLLLALYALNPPGGPKDLSPIKDFPRHRRLDECTDTTPVVRTKWTLTAEEQGDLVAVFSRAAGVHEVEVGRNYKGPRRVEFLGLNPVTYSKADVEASINRAVALAETSSSGLAEAQKAPFVAALNQFKAALANATNGQEWATRATPGLTAFRAALGTAGIAATDHADLFTEIAKLEKLAAGITGDAPALEKARTWIAGRLPVFVYVEDYPELVGHQDIAAYLARKAANPPQITKADVNFEKMCKVAGIDPQQLQTLHAANDHETRNQLTNRAGAVVTTELRRLWKDRALKVRFSPDANHLDTFVSDPNSVYDVEINLDERSRGLKWFFSFYVAFSADTRGGSADNAVLLLDEPGLHLHALSQGDLLRHLDADFKNQIIYSTHSPFMVPTENLDAVRTVNIGQDSGTTVTNDPTGDPRTLFPLQAALGYSLTQSLFVGPNNLVVEGVTDYWILASFSEYLHGVGKKGLPNELTITPAGGAQKVGYMIALLTSERLRVIVLLDDEKQARSTKERLLKAKLIRDESVIFVTEGYAASAAPTEADIEDLLDDTVYDALVRESYQAELVGKTLSLNTMVPRIVKRYESAFADVGLEFHKTRPARLLLTKMASEPDKIVTTAAAQRFQPLFEAIAKAHARNVARSAEPFQ